MRIDLIGKMSVAKASKNVKSVIEEVIEKAELPKDMKYKIQDLSCVVIFDVDGDERALTVTHGELQEIFNVRCALDKKGNIEKSVNNSTQSFVDDYTRSVVTGAEPPQYTEVIESEYDDVELCELSTLSIDDKKEVVYKHIKNMTYVLRYYVEDALVGEMTTNEIPQGHLQNMMK